MIADASPEPEVSREEVFGPVCTVTAVETLEEAIDRANGTRFGLQEREGPASAVRELTEERLVVLQLP